ncbi:hypothetical protein D1816_08040 [Aquimarina sp. AD10]|uniref:hypothetical protein n=1 Tax=Aquimarina TaxID=290174 RepID=UPI000E4ABAE3|nr:MULTISPECIES: hypothetical protein [Aquimarina]AXT60301.1 hypothetical protein D1816_08040 [Aquimarina sp. AD10]RKN01264.1 hypothetical protein D7033_05440 [Aquimarina sp. AD10]
MDELELLKKDWQKQEAALPRLSFEEIYQMILKKSSSIVKWIFVISVLEFLLWASIDIAVRLSGKYDGLEVQGLEGFSIVSTVLSYSILIYFIIRFYLNYKRIKTTDSAKILMQNILKTRKTVRHYIWVNISFLVITTMSIVGYLTFFTDTYSQQSADEDIPVFLVIAITIFVMAVAIAFIALFYRLIYGILTRRLKNNYNELEKLEL